MNLDKLASIVEGKTDAIQGAAVVGYTQTKLAKLSGISRDQLKRWDQAGYLCPARRLRGKASDCAYTRDQALGVIALGQLRRAGVKERQVREAAATLPIFVAEYAYLVFDGRMFYARSTDGEAMELMLRINRLGAVYSIYELAGKLR